MKARREAAELLVVGLPGLELGAGERAILEEVQPGGVVLLPRNIESVEQLQRLVAAVRRAAPRALLSLDAEGGRVDRLRKLLGPAPSAARLAEMPPRASEKAGRWVGYSLRAFGFDVDYAPVVDLDRGQVGTATDERYFGATPIAVVRRARCFLKGLHGSGIGGCVKHFPGLGGAGEDTHHLGSRVDLDRAELSFDLEPYRHLAARAAAVMVGHASYPSLDPGAGPASLSKAISTDLLRDELGFRGVTFSDDLEMHALDGDLADRAVGALEAGCDGLLFCHSLDELPRLVERLAAPDLAERRGEAVRRLAGYRRHLRKLGRGARAFGLETIRKRLSAFAVSTGR